MQSPRMKIWRECKSTWKGAWQKQKRGTRLVSNSELQPLCVAPGVAPQQEPLLQEYQVVLKYVKNVLMFLVKVSLAVNKMKLIH